MKYRFTIIFLLMLLTRSLLAVEQVVNTKLEMKVTDGVVSYRKKTRHLFKANEEAHDEADNRRNLGFNSEYDHHRGNISYTESDSDSSSSDSESYNSVQTEHSNTWYHYETYYTHSDSSDQSSTSSNSSSYTSQFSSDSDSNTSSDSSHSSDYYSSNSTSDLIVMNTSYTSDYGAHVHDTESSDSSHSHESREYHLDVHFNPRKHSKHYKIKIEDSSSEKTSSYRYRSSSSSSSSSDSESSFDSYFRNLKEEKFMN